MHTLKEYQISRPAVVAEVINGELVAIQLETGCYYNSNSTGSYVWSLLENGLSSANIAAEVANNYNISEQQAVKHVEAFIDTLLSENLINETTDSTPAVFLN
ncbi:MAG: PqqD family protein [Candidatus Andersenbacteria bacterium]